MLYQAPIVSPMRCAIPRNQQLLSKCTRSTTTRFMHSLQCQTTVRSTPTSLGLSKRISISARPLVFTSARASYSSSSQAAPPTTTLNWETFFRLRKVRRRFDVAGSIGSAVVFLAGGMGFILSDLTVLGYQLLTLDPVVLGVITFAFGALGWLVGPSIGNAFFNMFYTKYRPQMNAKDKALFERIKHYRVDPSSQSFQNPVPDFYGEKIQSVDGYRQWLKDQRAYNKKRGGFV